MFFDVLELQDEGIKVFHIDPGVMDTQMQEQIRQSDLNDFPRIEEFKSYYHNKII